MRSPPAPDVPTSPKTIMKKPPESSRPVREDSSSRSVSASRQRLPGQGPRYCRCAAIALLDPVSSAVITEKLDERSQLFGLGQTAQGAHAQQALDPDPAPRTRRRSTARRSAIARPRTWLDRAVRIATGSGRIERCSCIHNAQSRQAPSQLTPSPASTDPRRPVQSVRRRGHGLKPLATRRREFWNPQGSAVLRDVDDHVGAGFELADRGRAGEPVGVLRASCRRIIRDEHGHPRKG